MLEAERWRFELGCRVVGDIFERRFRSIYGGQCVQVMPMNRRRFAKAAVALSCLVYLGCLWYIPGPSPLTDATTRQEGELVAKELESSAEGAAEDGLEDGMSSSSSSESSSDSASTSSEEKAEKAGKVREAKEVQAAA